MIVQIVNIVGREHDDLRSYFKAEGYKIEELELKGAARNAGRYTLNALCPMPHALCCVAVLCLQRSMSSIRAADMSSGCVSRRVYSLPAAGVASIRLGRCDFSGSRV